MKSIILLIITVLLVACHTVQNTTKSVAKTAENVALNLDKTTEVESKNKTEIKKDSTATNQVQASDLKTEDWQSHLITYDTNKPIDSVTHRPPVATELIITKRLVSDRNNNTKTAIHTNQITKTAIKSDSTTHIKSKSAVKSTTQTTVRPIVQWWQWIIIGLIILLCVAFIVYFRIWRLF
jgi:PBP1b-binding outer membrane lipoprotein LpoB